MLGETEVMTGAAVRRRGWPGRVGVVVVGVVYLGVRRGRGVWGAEGTSLCTATGGRGGKLPPHAPT